MNTKTLKLLGGVFIIVVALTFFLVNRDTHSEEPAELATAIQFEGMTSTITDEITIVSPSQTLHFIKRDSAWFLDDREVQKEQMETFFEVLHETKVQSMASKNKDNHEKFQVTEKDGTKIIFGQDGEAQEFIIGKRGVDRETFYARNEDKTNVYLMNGELLSYLTQEKSDWTGGMEVFSYDPGVVQKVTVQDGYNTYTYGLDAEGNWAVITNNQFTPLAENRQKNLEMMTTHIAASSILEEIQAQEFREITRKISVVFADASGAEVENFRITKSGSSWWIERGESLYSVDQDIFSNIIGW